MRTLLALAFISLSAQAAIEDRVVCEISLSSSGASGFGSVLQEEVSHPRVAGSAQAPALTDVNLQNNVQVQFQGITGEYERPTDPYTMLISIKQTGATQASGMLVLQRPARANSVSAGGSVWARLPGDREAYVTCARERN